MLSLIPFSDSTVPPGLCIEADLQRRGSVMNLRFDLLGSIDLLDIPPRAPSTERRHNLWKATCLECFFGVIGSPSYWEVNVSPSGHWNLYAFDGYRSGMREESAFSSLPFTMEISPDRLRLDLALDAGRIVRSDQNIEATLCAVIQKKSGETSYWALTHGTDRPDFHRRQGFSIHL